MSTCGDFGGKKRKSDHPCTQAAGWGTDHPGTGKCKLHGGCSKGRPAKTGKYTAIPGVLNDDYLRRLEDPALKSLDDETALTEALIANAWREICAGGIPDWNKMADAFARLEKSTKGMNPSGFMEAMEFFRGAIEEGKRFANSQEALLSLINAKATLVEKSARVEERAGLVVSGRDFAAMIAWFGHFIAEEAARLNDQSILRRFQAELVRKGAYSAGTDDRNVASADGPAN